MATSVTHTHARVNIYLDTYTPLLSFSLSTSSSFRIASPLFLSFSHFHSSFPGYKIVKFLLFDVSCFGVIDVSAYEVNLISIMLRPDLALLCFLHFGALMKYYTTKPLTHKVWQEINFTDKSYLSSNRKCI